jgi:membrane protease subunit HflK
MAILPSWLPGAGIFKNEPPKSPWGAGGDKGGDKGDGGSGGPRNPWTFPPQGKRPRTGSDGPFDEWIKRARRGGGGGGFPGLPAGNRIWLIGLIVLVALWVAFTSVHRIDQREKGVVTMLGRYAGTLEPGWRFTLPLPFMSVKVIDVTNTRTEDFPTGSGENLMLTGDKNIVDLAYSVRWDIASAPDYAFQIAKPQETVRATAETAMRAVVATASLNDTIGSGRGRIEGQVQIAMQEILDEYHAGIRVQGVAIKNASAPQAVDEEFKQVSAAQQVLAAAQGEAAEFDKIYEQYKLAPEVTRRRLYYETMEAVLAKSNKTIIEAPGVTPYLALPDMKRKAEEPVAEPKQGGSR